MKSLYLEYNDEYTKVDAVGAFAQNVTNRQHGKFRCKLKYNLINRLSKYVDDILASFTRSKIQCSLSFCVLDSGVRTFLD